MAYQSLYRRYRPQKFSEIRGQRHVVDALRNAVARDEVGHAYLLHGPRGTGKTTTARVLAKALNCENLGTDGEPCGACESCESIEHGRSFDLHELDAASNNGVDAMRDLLGRVTLGTPGRAKVYLLDEVHMLSAGAENALLKSLEEPPDHVVWVLATTEPHKVVDTIRSRCQVFELNLLPAEEMAEHLAFIVDDAELDVDQDAIDYVIGVGGGSVRDTLSALDRVVAAGGMLDVDTSTDAVLDALADHDPGAALAAVEAALGRGRDPRAIGESVVAGLRNAFLTSMGSPPTRIAAPDVELAEALSGRLSASAITRALETIGTALVDMRQAPDPRVDLEVALVRVCRTDDGSVEALAARIDELERRLDGEASPAPAPPAPPAETPPTGTRSTATPAASTPSAPATDPEPVRAEAAPAPSRSGASPAAAARQALAQKRERAAGGREKAAAPASPAAPMPVPAVPAAERVDLTALTPSSPSEVVDLADRHLGIDRDTVVARATEILGPADGRRSPTELATLWQTLLAEHASPPAPEPAPDPRADDPVAISDDSVAPSVEETPPFDDHDAAPPEEEPTPAAVDRAPPEPAPAPTAPVDDAGNEVVDLTELVDAPDHADHVIDQLTEMFPGAELHTTPEEDA